MIEPGSLPTPTHVEAEQPVQILHRSEPGPIFPVFVTRGEIEGLALAAAMFWLDVVEWWAQFLPKRR